LHRGPSSGPLAQAASRSGHGGAVVLAHVPAAGTVLDTTWIDETVRSSRIGARRGGRGVPQGGVAAGVLPGGARIIDLLGFSVLARVVPAQGLVISTRLYEELGGHRDGASDPRRTSSPASAAGAC